MKKFLIVIAVVIGLAIIGKLALHDNDDAPIVAKTDTTNTATASPSAAWKDGTYTGVASDNEYGTIQVAAVISGGKISAVNFLKMPSGDQRTNEVTAAAQPILLNETLKAQSASIDLVSGATQTSNSYLNSLNSALNQARS